MVATMYEITDKLLLFCCCTTLYLFNSDFSYVIVPVIITVLLSSLFVYFENDRLKLAGNICFIILCIFVPGYIAFLPLMLYDILHSRYQYAALTVPFLFYINMMYYSAMVFSFTIILFLVAYLLKYKTDKLKILQVEYNELRDNSSEISLLLEEKNLSLLKNQDSEINLATLNERNRISKEIHDNIGHLLSRAILQVGALLTITKDEVTQQGLSSLKVSLSDGMNQIRNSIHQMYNESIDLYSQIEHLVNDFTFCQIYYEYDINNPPALPLKHGLIAIIKESLVNIIHHSNASKVSLILREHPAMYQLIIQDNGVVNERKKQFLLRAIEIQDYGDGMGLRNISDRVKGFDGILNLSFDNGFQLFISIPKKQK